MAVYDRINASRLIHAGLGGGRLPGEGYGHIFTRGGPAPDWQFGTLLKNHIVAENEGILTSARAFGLQPKQRKVERTGR